MNKIITVKKHSRILAKLAFKKGIITKKHYQDLYWCNYNQYKICNRRDPHGYTYIRYFTQLYYCTCDYSGEYDEHCIDLDIMEYVFDELNPGVMSLFYENNGKWPEGIKLKKVDQIIAIRYLRTLPNKINKNNKCITH